MIERRNLKTSNLIIAIKHVLKIEFGPETHKRQKRTYAVDSSLSFKCKINCKFQH